jgi:predicted MPP superfamily phosphohydrolase
MTRRQWVSWCLKAGLTSSAGAYIYGAQVERHLLTHEQIKIPLNGIGPALAGLKLVQISDLHLHPVTTAEMISKTVAAVNALTPDLILITGDFITQQGHDAGELADILKGLRSSLGTYGVMGNHDCWHSPRIVQQELERVGIRILTNKAEKLAVSGESLWIGGTDSVWAGYPDRGPAMPENPSIPTVMLIHEPDFADVVATKNRQLLQLSGHSHGGQVRAPLLGAPVTVDWGRKYVRGLYQIGKVRLYVNRGIGCTGLGVRFACPPEITTISLTSSD